MKCPDDCGAPNSFGRHPTVPPPPPDRGPRGGFFMQRILACGKLHRRSQCCEVCLSALPPEARPPYRVTDVAVCSCPQWEEADEEWRNALSLLVTVPLKVRLRDAGGRCYAVPASITQSLCLRCECPARECWRGQIFVQAAVRLSCRPQPCDQKACALPLEVLLEGYVLSPCAVNCGNRPACHDTRPLYPQPLFDPYRE